MTITNIAGIMRKTKYHLNTCPKCKERLQLYKWQDSKECNTCGYYRHWKERYWTQQDWRKYWTIHKVAILKTWMNR